MKTGNILKIISDPLKTNIKISFLWSALMRSINRLFLFPNAMRIEINGCLFHFTRFDTACKIIADQSLKFGSLDRMNDPNESSRTIYLSLNLNNNITWADFHKTYKQISLSENDDNTPVFLNMPMWAHYADKGKGVCIMLDKNLLIDKLCPKKHWHSRIKYSNDYISDIIIYENDDTIVNEKDKLFFTKTKHWEYEQEYRIVCFKQEQENIINISGCIKGIIMLENNDENPRRNSSEYKVLKTLMVRHGLQAPFILGNFFEEWTLTDEEDKSIWKGKSNCP